MCLNCTCGEPNARPKDGDITLEDLKKAAENHGMEVEETADNIHASARELQEAGKVS